MLPDSWSVDRPMSDDITSIHAYRQASPDISTSGQPRDQHFAAIAAAGYTTVVNLGLQDEKRYALEIARRHSNRGIR